MIGFIGPSITITITNHGCLRLAPFLTELRVSSLLSDWLGSDLRVGHSSSFRCPLVNTPQLNTQLLNSLTTQLRMNRSSPHGSLYSPARIHGKCLLLARIHGKLWTFVESSLTQERVLASRLLPMDFRCGSTIPAFRRHVTILKLKQVSEQFRVLHNEEVAVLW
jgi:hypothetical protein